MNIDMQSPEIQKLKKENPEEYRRKYDHHRLYNKDWYCDICNNGKNYRLIGKWSHLAISEALLWFFVFLLYGITFHSLPQDGRHPKKSPVNNDLQVK